MKAIVNELKEIKELLKNIERNQEQLLKIQKTAQSCTVSRPEQKDKITVSW